MKADNWEEVLKMIAKLSKDDKKKIIEFLNYLSDNECSQEPGRAFRREDLKADE